MRIPPYVSDYHPDTPFRCPRTRQHVHVIFAIDRCFSQSFLSFLFIRRPRCSSRVVMASVHVQTSLKQLWTTGRKGDLCAKEQLKAVCYRDVMRDLKVADYGMTSTIARKLRQIDGGHPTSQALGQFFVRVDNDQEWFPGKSYQTRFGPQRVLSGGKRQSIARSAMALKRRKREPTYSKTLVQNPNAVINPRTQKPVSKQVVYRIFRENCCDGDPDFSWRHQARLHRRALPPATVVKRLHWANGVHTGGSTMVPGWCLRHVVWIDFCNSILPRSEQKAEEQVLARKGRRGWLSKDCANTSLNLLVDDRPLNQKSWDAERAWWMLVLSRGMLHIEPLPECPGETPAGAAYAVSKLNGIL